jgi:transposase
MSRIALAGRFSVMEGQSIKLNLGSSTKHRLIKSLYGGTAWFGSKISSPEMPHRRYEPTDEQFDRIEPVLPKVDGRGCPYKDHRQVLNGIFWILRSGAPWRDLPERYGSWKTVYDRFRRCAEDGTLEAIVQHLQGELDAEGRIDWEQFNVDSTVVQAAQAASGSPNDDKKGIEPTEKTQE